MLYTAVGSENTSLLKKDLDQIVADLLVQLGDLSRILILPPDFTRVHSASGTLTEIIWNQCSTRVKKIMPALGTHFPMTGEEKKKMFGSVPEDLIVDHDWQNNLTELGRIDSSYIKKISGGKLDFDWPVQVNRILTDESWDLIFSIGQVVPHEIAGMANYTKNVLIGTGGKEAIDKSHFLGAVCGMENIMGHADTPVRQLFNHGADLYCRQLPIVYIQTVVSVDEGGQVKIRGIYAGDDEECYQRAAELSAKVNIHYIDHAPAKVVTYLDPEEFRSTWIGNKSIYRTRMAIPDGGELIILAPGVHCFGENKGMDELIRKYGYKGSDYTLKAVEQNRDLQESLSVAAHLLHGSVDGRFKITYCPGGLSRDEVEQIGFSYGSIKEYSKRYDINQLKEGWNILEDGEEIYYISNPALGLWSK